MTPRLGNALEFEVTVQGYCCHSKVNGGGFISTKEKLIKCAVKIVKRLGGDGKIKPTQTTKGDAVAEIKLVQQDVPEDGICKIKAREKKE